MSGLSEAFRNCQFPSGPRQTPIGSPKMPFRAEHLNAAKVKYW
jgi:hypothetical protein